MQIIHDAYALFKAGSRSGRRRKPVGDRLPHPRQPRPIPGRTRNRVLRLMA
jgi:hypothetical protein